MKYGILFLLVLCSRALVFAEAVDVYPTHWWVGMKNSKLQLMVHATDIGIGASVSIRYPGVTVTKVNKVESKNYLFIDLYIQGTAKPGRFTVKIENKDKPVSFEYELRARRPGNGHRFAQGINSSDFVYLLMPDRF